MQAGGERLLTIPAALAYGNKSQAGIPANSTLIFGTSFYRIEHLFCTDIFALSYRGEGS